MVVLAWVTAIFQNEESPLAFVLSNNNSRFIILSMITRKSDASFESHDLIQPTRSLNRVLSDLALLSKISLYSGFGFIRLALPKLQNIIKPRSWVLLLYCSFCKTPSIRSAS